MNNDPIKKIFEHVKDQLDIHEPSSRHEVRFLEKLQQQSKVVQLSPKKKNWYKPLAIAASIAVLLGIATLGLFSPAEKAELASVSPQMQETQSFFTSAIQLQLEEIDKISSTKTKELVTDAMLQIQKLESDYEILKSDLVSSESDKRVISAMIKNFQQRANLLEEVLQKINNINQLKSLENENAIL